MNSAAARSFAHISDLHLGAGPEVEEATQALVQALRREQVDRVLITGDVTHRGRKVEVERFQELFGPLRAENRLVVVPGNHDRMTDDVRNTLMPGPRVQSIGDEHLHLVCLDSSAPHNKRLHLGHGVIAEEDLAQVERHLDRAPPGALSVLLLHHHALPLPVEDWAERITCWLGLPWCAELRAGQSLLERVRGRCDLVLHGHRHVEAEAHLFPGTRRPLRVFNAGSTSMLGRWRLFRHHRGALLEPPRWVKSRP